MSPTICSGAAAGPIMVRTVGRRTATILSRPTETPVLAFGSPSFPSGSSLALAWGMQTFGTGKYSHGLHPGLLTAAPLGLSSRALELDDRFISWPPAWKPDALAREPLAEALSSSPGHASRRVGCPRLRVGLPGWPPHWSRTYETVI
jgi:hypothetical protein